MSSTFPYDHISNLPDDVLSDILSRLSLKDAVQTSILSKDWEFKWASIYNVDIHIENLSIEKELNFFIMVERILHHLENVNNFHLTCSSPLMYKVFGMTALVTAISGHSVKHLELAIYNTQDFDLHWSLLNFTSLWHLYAAFETPCSFRFRAKNCYPNLKHLALENVRIVNDILNTDTLIFTFPVLKSLQLTECDWVNVKFVEIHAPSLLTFTSITPFEWDNKDGFDYSIKFFGNELYELEAGGGYPENISMIGSKVTFANFNWMCDNPLLSLEEHGLQVRKVLRDLPNLEYLNVEEIRGIGKTKLGLSLPRFSKLKTLHLGMIFDDEGMIELLHAAPFVKHLEISFLDDDENENDYEYDSVITLPYCVLHRLEVVKLYYDYGGKSPTSNFGAEKFLLKNGARLRTVSVGRLDGVSEKELIETLSTFPKASKCLRIVGC